MNNFKFAKILYFFIYSFVYICLSSNLQADSYFTVNNIEIKLKFDNSRDIRNIAIQKAQKKSFQELSEKLLTPNDYKLFLADDEIDTNYLVDSIEFVDENITPEFYKGVFNINFNPYRVREFYSSKSLMYSEVTSKVIPIFTILAKQDSFFTLNNIWNTKWSDIDLRDQILRLNVETLKPSESRNISLTSFLSGKFNQTDLNYDLSNSILIWCEPILIGGGNIEFHIITKIIINNKSSVLRSKYTKTYNVYNENLFDDVINDLKEKILVKWVDLTSRTDEMFQYAFTFDTNSIDEWVKLENIFEKIDLLSNYRITSFDLSSIQGIVEFNGNSNKFELVLKQNSILPVNLGKVYKIQITD